MPIFLVWVGKWTILEKHGLHLSKNPKFFRGGTVFCAQKKFTIIQNSPLINKKNFNMSQRVEHHEAVYGLSGSTEDAKLHGLRGIGVKVDFQRWKVQEVGNQVKKHQLLYIHLMKTTISLKVIIKYGSTNNILKQRIKCLLLGTKLLLQLKFCRFRFSSRKIES